MNGWTPEFLGALDRCENWGDVSSLAKRALRAMSEHADNITIVCGPISSGGLGSLEENLKRFARVVERATLEGYVVFSFIPLERVITRLSPSHNGEGDYDMSILDVMYREIYDSGLISVALFIPGWNTSKGATWERGYLGRVDGLTIEDVPKEWL